MASGRSGLIRGEILRLFDGESVAGLGDGELLGRFADRRDEAAFEALVTRHGPTVLGVCRRMLADPHDVEDAFQATFLVLVRRAGSIRDRELVGPWLHGVAARVARRARAESARRLARERRGGVAEAREPGAEDDVDGVDLRPLIDEEIGRLPEHYRRAVLLCDVEGLGREEAARRLGWTPNMLRGRLARARERLRGRLSRRGLAPSGAWSTLVAPPSLPPALASTAARAALSFSVGRMGMVPASASAVALSRGVLRMMMLSKWNLAASVALSAGFVAAGAGLIAAQGPGDTPPGPGRPTAPVPEAGLIKAWPKEMPGGLAALAKSRVEMARRHLKTERAFYDEERITIDRILDASQALMKAELDATDVPAARLAAILVHLDLAKEVERRVQAELKKGRATDADFELSQTRRLDAEFLLAKESEAPEPKAAQAPPPDPFRKARPVAPEAPGGLAALGKGRVEMARRRFETQKVFYQEGRLTIDRLLNASQTLMDAEVDAGADIPGVRVGAIRTHLDRIKEIEKREQAELEVGRATASDIEEVQTQRLDIEYRLAKEETKPEPRPAADLERRVSEVERKVDRVLNLLNDRRR